MTRVLPMVAAGLLVAGCSEQPNSLGQRVSGPLQHLVLSVVIQPVYTPSNASVLPNQNCTYRGVASGGTSPYTYTWAKGNGVDSIVAGGAVTSWETLTSDRLRPLLTPFT